MDLRVAHSADTLAMALKRTARPLVADYHSDNAMEHFSAAGMNGNRTVLVIFLSRRANHYAQLHDALQATALERANNVSHFEPRSEVKHGGISLNVLLLHRCPS